MFFDHYPYTNFHNVNLDWVLQAVKSWGAMVEVNNQGFIDLKAANASFKEYVTHYLQNLDVSDEINDKLDQMLADGVLDPYMAPYIQTDVSAWLAQHITPTTPAVDSSLTISGAAADAAKVGKMFADVNEDFDEDVKNWAKLQGVKIISGNLYNSNINRGDGAYYYDGSSIKYAAYANNKWYVIPVESNTSYYSPYPIRFWYTLDANNNVVAHGENATLTPAAVRSGVNAATMMICYNYVNYPDPEIYKGRAIPSDTTPVYVTPNNVFLQNENVEGMVEAGGYALSHNIFDTSELLTTGAYVDIDKNGKVGTIASGNYNSYIIPVVGGTYYFTSCRTAVLLAADKYTAIGSVKTYVTEIDTTGASYLAFSFNPTAYPVDKYVIQKPVKRMRIPANWITSDNEWKSIIAKTSRAFASGGGLEIKNRTAIKDGQRIVFKGTIATFSSVTLSFCTTSIEYQTEYITVTGTEVTARYGTDPVDTRPHNLTILHDIELVLVFDNGKAKLSVISNGHRFDTEYTWYQTAATITYPAVTSSGSRFLDATLSLVNNCAKRDIWIFGDSYITFNQPQRYPYYLVSDGYAQNALFNGAGGINSGFTPIAFQNLLKFGTPKYAVMATGMNDGSDSSSDSPAATWEDAKNSFLSICNVNGIIPIFCTIPTVPTINNEGKNTWIKSSGYRYIDFAKAVGASETGEWYAGMIAGDGIHPSIEGAIALYSQLLADFPEIMAG